jgi:ketosteroid isomerase-like protein
MATNDAILLQFYTAFQQRDADTMTALYHPDAEFSDPVFLRLKGEQVGAMWHMLLTSNKDLNLHFRDLKANNLHGFAHWEADYFFSATGRKVHNVVEAKFTFQDGKIITHKDSFSLSKWAAQALGPLGLLLGWTPFMQASIRKKASLKLADFLSANK